jgi:phage-related protein
MPIGRRIAGNRVRHLLIRNTSDSLRCTRFHRLTAERASALRRADLIHAFQKKSKTGIKTAKHEIDLIHARLHRLKEIAQ